MDVPHSELLESDEVMLKATQTFVERYGERPKCVLSIIGALSV